MTLYWIAIIAIAVGALAIYKLCIEKKPRRQPCLVVTEDNRIVHVDIPVKLGHLVLTKEMEAYVHCPEILAYENGSDQLVAILDERDAMPMPLSGKAAEKRKSYTKDRIDEIAQSCHDRALIETERKNHKDKLVSMLSFILGAFGLVTLIVIVAGIFLVKS